MRVLWLLFVLVVLGALEVGIVWGKHAQFNKDVAIATEFDHKVISAFAIVRCSRIMFAMTVNGDGTIVPVDPASATPEALLALTKNIPDGSKGILTEPCADQTSYRSESYRRSLIRTNDPG